MTLANLSSPSFTGAELAGRVNASLLEARAARRFPTASALLADTAMAYGTGSRPVAAGDRIATADGFAWQVAAASTTAHVVSTAGGVRLRPLRGTDGAVNAAQFGALGNGTADDTAAIQAAIDFAIHAAASEGRCRVRLNPGTFRTTDTIHLGYGVTTFNSVTFEGAGNAYRGEGHFSGTTLRPTFSDRPCINVQGARDSTIRGLALIGQFNAFAQAQGLGSSGSLNTVDDTNPAAWADPGLSANFDSRYAPYAGICVDGYSGTRPATSYPNVAYPAFLGTVAQYGKHFSSGVLLEDVEIGGFAVALAIQPCDADGNGDFIEWRRGRIFRCKWGVSAGNTQGRNVVLDGVDVSGVFAVLTNRQHGRRQGKLGGSVRDLSIWGAVNLLDFDGAFAGPMVFTNLYAESLWRIGTILSQAGGDDHYVFTGCRLKFSGQHESGVNPHRGVPATVLDGGTQASSITFDGCYFWGFPSVAMFKQAGLVFRGGCHFRPVDGLRTKSYEFFAHNALGGGLVVTGLDNPVVADLRTRPFNLDTGATLGLNVRTPLCTVTRRRSCIPWYGDSFGAESEDHDTVPNRTRAFRRAVAKSALSACSVAGRTLTMTFAARTEAEFLLLGPSPGDVILDDATDTAFFVFSRTGTTVLAQAQTNYRADGTLIVPFPATGNLFWRSSRFYTPPFFLRADTATGSPTLTNVARDDGFAAWFDAEIAVGDAVAVRETQDRWISLANVTVTARSQATGTITLAANPARAETRRRLDLLARTGPANEAAP